MKPEPLKFKEKVRSEPTIVKFKIKDKPDFARFKATKGVAYFESKDIKSAVEWLKKTLQKYMPELTTVQNEHCVNEIIDEAFEDVIEK